MPRKSVLHILLKFKTFNVEWRKSILRFLYLDLLNLRIIIPPSVVKPTTTTFRVNLIAPLYT